MLKRAICVHTGVGYMLMFLCQVRMVSGLAREEGYRHRRHHHSILVWGEKRMEKGCLGVVNTFDRRSTAQWIPVPYTVYTVLNILYHHKYSREAKATDSHNDIRGFLSNQPATLSSPCALSHTLRRRKKGLFEWKKDNGEMYGDKKV